MRYMKYYNKKVYWRIKKDDDFVKKLEKLGCEKSTIDDFLKYVEDKDEINYYVGLESRYYDSKWSINVKSIYFFVDNFEFLGALN